MYLDTVNNVAHVGHCHPVVVEEGIEQMRLLNTNTRYLHEAVVELSERLIATFPREADLEVCTFVCTGSEANELAVRLSKTYTSSSNFVVMDVGYHGNTSSLVDLGAYKFNGPGGKGCPPHVTLLTTPMSSEEEVIDSCIEEARKKISSLPDVAAFFCEPILSCGGQIVLPARFLEEVYCAVRAKGGLCISDEVQTGFGRVGSCMWGFQLYEGIFPDIVTMGKPMGNGHPVAAVITSRKVADAFHNGMEYFNTFGGNPVSCRIALAVLDVLEREHLMSNAKNLGDFLKNMMKALQTVHKDLISDVRGEGFFLGLEFLGKKGDDVEKGAALASYVVRRLKDFRILSSVDGPRHNVIKFKPPMTFSLANANAFVKALKIILSENFCLKLNENSQV
eukprot:TRINITY_DN10081_c0_g1_i1.p1 TRINITY_DN10081_c0_g1~~TRINITY_DN10081_c0_g1_i1.p1  ORF type:complete len:450 (+),score=123.82 TRINITY_DN10081_c0_g1_i1:174-1352(+)